MSDSESEYEMDTTEGSTSEESLHKRDTYSNAKDNYKFIFGSGCLECCVE